MENKSIKIKLPHNSMLDEDTHIIITNYLQSILDNICKNMTSLNLRNDYLEPVLLFITSIYDYVDDKELIDQFGHTCSIMIQRKLQYMSKNNLPFSYGLYTTPGIQAFSVNEFSQKTGLVPNFNNSLTEFYIEIIERDLEYILSLSYNEFSYITYDLIMGLSGTLIFLINLNSKCNKLNLLISKIVDFLSSLADFKIHKNLEIPKFHIPNKSLSLEEERKEFKDGILNFGLAHGFIGIALSLSLALEKGYYTNKSKSTIYQILKIYEDFKFYDNSIPFWPGQLDINLYYNKVDIPYFKASSWCYGNIGVSNALKVIYSKMDLIDKKFLISNDIRNIVNQNPEFFLLSSPSLCHGLSSILAIGNINKAFEYKNLNILIHKIINQSIYNSNMDIIEIEKSPVPIECRIDDFDILTGSIGLGLSLLSVYNTNGIYNQLFFLS